MDMYLLFFFTILTVLDISGAAKCPTSCVCFDTTVDCSGVGLTAIPDPKTISKKTTTLLLNDNSITKLRESSFNDLPNLQILSLAGNGLTKITGNVFTGMTKLRSLDISSNSISKVFKESFNGLRNLRSLSMSRNKLTRLARCLNELPKLNSLIISFNQLDRLVEKDFHNNTMLRMLDLGDNKVESIGDNTFDNQESLRYFIIKNNPLKQIEVNFNHTMIQLADFTNCELTSVPNQLPPSVNDLRLGNNKITILNETDISHIKSLSLLTLNNNLIDRITYRSMHKLKNLKEVWLNGNQLVYIPRDLPKGVIKLNMDDNLIEELEPNLFKNDSKLEYLSLNANKIYKIPNSAFSGLQHLREIHLKSNMIRRVKNGTFSNMTSLEKLSLSNNRIKRIDEGAFSDLESLKQLDISYVEAKNTTLKDNFINGMPNVEHIEMINSPSLVLSWLKLLEDDDYDIMANTSVIHLEYNDLTTLPDVIQDVFPNLTAMYLDGNPWRCDDKLVWLLEWMRTMDMIRFYQNEELVCETPRFLSGKKLSDINIDTRSRGPGRNNPNPANADLVNDAHNHYELKQRMQKITDKETSTAKPRPTRRPTEPPTTPQHRRRHLPAKQRKKQHPGQRRKPLPTTRPRQRWDRPTTQTPRARPQRPATKPRQPARQNTGRSTASQQAPRRQTQRQRLPNAGQRRPINQWQRPTNNGQWSTNNGQRPQTTGQRPQINQGQRPNINQGQQPKYAKKWLLRRRYPNRGQGRPVGTYWRKKVLRVKQGGKHVQSNPGG